MKRDKYILIQKPIFTATETGGTKAAYTVFWQGWAEVIEKTYSTTLEQSQWTGNKMLTFNIRKNGKTDQLTTDMRISYRGKIYDLDAIREIDRFTLEVNAKIKQV